MARECSAGDGASAARLLSFGEICLLASELQQCYDKETPQPPLLSKLSEKTCGEKKRIERKMSKSSPKYEVFLGGSCNPTTWRQKVAIPMLKDHGISFYNPQVSHWEEALVEVEYQAKQTASVVFIVLDRHTRNVASMVEAAYMAGCRRKLVVVMDSYTGPGQLINGEPISEREYQDLTSGFNTVRDLVERQEIPVFGEITHALNCTAKILREDIYPQDLGSEDDVKPVKYPYLQLDDKLLKIHDAFINTNSEQITLAEAQVVYKMVTNKELTNEELQMIVAFKKGIDIQELNGMELPLNEISITVDEFYGIVTEFKNPHLETKRLWDILSRMSQRVIGWAIPRRPVRSISTSSSSSSGSTTSTTNTNNSTSGNSGGRDIYLGGSVGERVTWREELAVPLLLKNGLSYFNPAASSRCSSGRLLPMEAVLMEHSRVLLFVITDTTRGVSAMTLASHYIGLGCNVVLCVQMLTESSLVDGEQLSRHALKDYNRGRTYLVDQAKKDGISVYSDIQEALECAVAKAQAR